MTITTPQEEERAARKAARDLAKLHKGAERAREKETRSRLAAVIREELAKPRARDCHCGLTSRTTMAELRELGAGCTAGRWVCPTLDAVRRRMGR